MKTNTEKYPDTIVNPTSLQPDPKQAVTNMDTTATNVDDAIVNTTDEAAIPGEDTSKENELQRAAQQGESRSSRFTIENENEVPFDLTDEQDPYAVEENDDIY